MTVYHHKMIITWCKFEWTHRSQVDAYDITQTCIEPMSMASGSWFELVKYPRNVKDTYYNTTITTKTVHSNIRPIVNRPYILPHLFGHVVEMLLP